MLKVEHKDLEEITKFLDKFSIKAFGNPQGLEAAKLSKKIKDKYTEIKPDYEQ